MKFFDISILFITIIIILGITEAKIPFVRHKEIHHISERGHVHLFANISRVREDHLALENAILTYGRHHNNSYMFKHQLKGVMLKIEDIENLFLEPSRERRQAGAVLGIFGLGLSVYEETQILQLQADAKAQDRVNDAIYETLGHEEQSINQNSENIQSLNGTLYSLISMTEGLVKKIQGIRVQEEIQEAINKHEVHVDQWRHDLIQMVRGDLPSTFIAEGHLAELFARIQQIADKKQGRILMENPRDILKLPISYVTEKDGIDIFIHLDIIRKSEFELHEFVDLPILTEGHQYSVETERKFLLIDTEQTQSAEVKKDFLDSCFPFKDTLICAEERIFVPPNENCLGCLFTNDACIRDYCKIFVHLKPVSAHLKVDAQNFALHFPKRVTVNHKCGTNVTTVDFAEGTQFFRLKAGCEIVSKSLWIKQQVSDFHLEDLNFYLTPHVIPLFELMEEPELEALETLKGDLGKLKNPPKIDLSKLNSAIATKKNIDQNTTFIIILIGVSSLSILFLALILFHLCNKHLQNFNSAP